ncbi:MAG: hypothetical protein M1819_006916 [Sarea resinae]|nr:MAG: hypothetical protein M1819_006916 [Sarea resinae]
MDFSQDFKTLQEQISLSLINATRTVGQIANEDLAFQRSLDPSLASTLDEENARLLNIAQRLFKAASSGSEIEMPALPDADALENNWRAVVDVVDNLLEKADTCLDEYTGVIKRLSPARQERDSTPKSKKLRPTNAFRTQNIPKPQRLFNHVPSNDETVPFKPLLTSKPHAIVPLSESLSTFLGANGSTQFKHPYEEEISQYEYPASVYQNAEPIPYLPFESTEAEFVDTPEAVLSMLAELKAAKEIAIDLEHHDTRSYTGIVSLMQISTRNKDWVVDTLKPWRRDLQVLNEVFADPNILKVLHGSFMDIIWLQRDLGLYIVGLFDTYHAAQALGYPKHSLASLLARFVDFDADKQYQMADWRIRPLPEEMFKYARADTHFLLYIFDCMRNELVDKSSRSSDSSDYVVHVLERSKDYALQRYERPIYDETRGLGQGGWYDMLSRTPALFSKEQFAVFRAVHQWRDTVARQDDDSLHYVMPKHVIFSIAKATPTDMPSLLSVCHPISQPVRSRAGELLSVIEKAKAAGAEGPEMLEILRPAASRRGQHIPQAEVSSSKMDVDEVSDQIEHSKALKSTEGLSVRSEISHFWGKSFGSSLWEGLAKKSSGVEGLRLAVPLPQLTAEVFKDPGEDRAPAQQPTPVVDPGARAEHQHVEERKPREDAEDGIFVVKQLGGGKKRKSDEMLDPFSLSTTSDAEVSTSNGRPSLEEDQISIKDEDAAARKAARKAQKKLDKRRRKEEAQNADGSANGQGGDSSGYDRSQAFDYTKAESVLHAKDSKAQSATSKNPYAKSADAPKGARKSRQEKPGKSFTFKH